ncbi:unnamed protein product [Nippostrongylus brasiliensis]|uniref:Secreted protein n=1 Tax=Nippostrongylus brasiliensis TaxID=27835 RepID=A0A0N4XYE5_NIPBR|nr:unnamed protein product [Nippostrongylus brasiliensis]
MFLLLPALLVANVAAYGVYQPTDCKPLEKNDQIVYKYSEELDDGYASNGKYKQGTTVEARCAKQLWDLMERCSLKSLKDMGYSTMGEVKLHGADKVENQHKVTTKEGGDFTCCLGFWVQNDQCANIMKQDH